MKVTIIGAAGKVGAATAFALQMSGLVRELALIDVMEQAASGEALDLLHGSALCGPLDVRSGGYEAAAGSDVVVVTAGLKRKPEETRLQLVGRNVSLFRDILARLEGVTLAEGAILMVVANPVDILTHLAVEAGWAVEKTVGTGTLLDTVRLCSLLGQRLRCDPRAIQVLVLGEHGDSMVPVWSQARIGDIPLDSYPGFTREMREEVFQAVKGAGAEMIRLKQGAAHAIALCVRELLHAIAADARCSLPVTTLQQGACGIEGVCLSMPTVIGKQGVRAVTEPALAPQELDALRASAAVLRGILAEIKE